MLYMIDRSINADVNMQATVGMFCLLFMILLHNLYLVIVHSGP